MNKDKADTFPQTIKEKLNLFLAIAEDLKKNHYTTLIKETNVVGITTTDEALQEPSETPDAEWI